MNQQGKSKALTINAQRKYYHLPVIGYIVQVVLFTQIHQAQNVLVKTASAKAYQRNQNNIIITIKQ